MNCPKSILVISFSNLAVDPRVNRQIRWLRDSFRVVCAGLADPRLDDVEFIPITSRLSGPFVKAMSSIRLLSRQYESYYWRHPWVADAGVKLRDVGADLVLANDVETLPLGLQIAGNAPVLLDAHEYAPRQFEDRFVFRVFFQGQKTYLCKKYIPQAAAMMTVSTGIANQYEADVGVKPHVVLSTPEFSDLQPQPVRSDKIRLIHHGAATRSRRLERLIELMDHLDERFELNLMLIETSAGYVRQLQKLASRNERIRFLPPVPMPEIVRTINRFDVGLAYFEPSTFNLRHVLPNKFFEFIQARLAVAIGPSPEMAEIVQRHDLGPVASEFSPAALADRLNALTGEQLMQFKHNAHGVARRFSAETTGETLVSIIDEILQR